jgi:ribonuclease HIII
MTDIIERIDEALNEGSVTYEGSKNQEKIRKLLNKAGFDSNVEPNGKFSVKINGKDVTIFKDDVVTIKNKNVTVTKPSYVTGKKG